MCASNNMLQWFVAEQVEEEAVAEAILQNLRPVADHPQGLFMMDQELGKRQVPVGPVAEETES